MNVQRDKRHISKYILLGLTALYAVGFIAFSLLHYLQPFTALNILLSITVLSVGCLSLRTSWDPYFIAGIIIIIMGLVFVGEVISPDNLTSGAILLTGIIVLYVGLQLLRHLPRWRLGLFVGGYLVLFWIFVEKLSNAEPLFILYLLGLSATARSVRLTVYFWAVVVSFSFCQPYAWESLLVFAFVITALFGARGRARSLTTTLFLGAGLLLVFSLLFPIISLLVGQDLHSYDVLLRDPRIRAAMSLTLVTAGISTLLLLLFVVPLAYALSRLRFPGRQVLLSLIDLPIVIPQSAAGIALLLIWGRRQFFGGMLGDLTGIYVDGTVVGICVAQLFVAMPFLAKSALSAFDAVGEELEAVAATLGAPPFSVYWRIALPLAAQGIAAGAVLAFARAAGEFGALVILAPTPETAPVAVFNRFNSMGLSEAAPLVSLVLLLSLGAFFLLQLVTRLLPLAHRTPGQSARQVEESA